MPAHYVGENVELYLKTKRTEGLLFYDSQIVILSASGFAKCCGTVGQKIDLSELDRRLGGFVILRSIANDGRFSVESSGIITIDGVRFDKWFDGINPFARYE